MMRGTVYHIPASEFQRTSYLVGSKSGVMHEWTDDVVSTNASAARFADVELSDAPIRAHVDGKWQQIWLHDHVVRTTGCLPIPDRIVSYTHDHLFDVLFVYKLTSVLLKHLSMADVTRVRRWFHGEVEISSSPLVP